MAFRRAFRWGTASVLLLVLVGHFLYWYWPRGRTADPAESQLAAWALQSEELPVGLWLPYPHQNLGVLAGRWGSLDTLAADLALFVGSDAPTLPRFGLFRVPPASELAAAFDPLSEDFLLAARVYPVWALVARAAGRLAGNPWLGGGVIEEPSRIIEVSWQGRTWLARTVSKPGEALPAARGKLPALGQVSLAARLETPLGRLPQGLYVLRPEASELIFETVPGPPREPLPTSLLADDVSLAAWGRSLEGEALGLVAFDGAADDPGFAWMTSEPAKRLPLAGLGLAVLLGREGHSGRASGWYVLANSERTFRRCAFLVPELESLAAAEGSAGVGWVAVLRPGLVVAGLEQVVENLEGMGAVGQSPRRRAAALLRLLAPLRTSERASFLLLEDPPSLRVRLEQSEG